MSKDKHIKGNTREYSKEYKEWRRLVFGRDGSKCVKCGSFKKLHAHHIQSWKDNPEKRFLLSNGETLCYSCHVEIHPFMIKYENDKRTRTINKYLKKKQRRENKKRKKGKFLGFRNSGKFKPKKNIDQYENYRFNKDNPNPNWT